MVTLSTYDWPLSQDEKKCCVLRNYEKDVQAADSLLDLDERMLRRMSRELLTLRGICRSSRSSRGDSRHSRGSGGGRSNVCSPVREEGSETPLDWDEVREVASWSSPRRRSADGQREARAAQPRRRRHSDGVVAQLGRLAAAEEPCAEEDCVDLPAGSPVTAVPPTPASRRARTQEPSRVSFVEKDASWCHDAALHPGRPASRPRSLESECRDKVSGDLIDLQRMDVGTSISVMSHLPSRPLDVLYKPVHLMKAASNTTAGVAAVYGVKGCVVGGCTGTAVGFLVGLPMAVFTLGLSVPICTGVGSACGACTGTLTGSAYGLVYGRKSQ